MPTKSDFNVANGQYNIGHICTRRQCDAGHGQKIALRFIKAGLQATTEYTFADLERESNRWANVFHALGLKPGEIVFAFLPKTPELFFAFLGALKQRLVIGTLFSNFGEEALFDRLGDSQARVVITRRSMLKKINDVRVRLPQLRYVLLIDVDDHLADDVLSFPRLRAAAPSEFTVACTSPETPSVLHYTSGSTGRPKGVLHVHRSVLAQARTAREVLQLSDNSIYWCTADQGWVTGTSYGIIGPWSLGVTQIHYGGSYQPEHWFKVLERERVTVWYSAPTALRMLMREPAESFKGYNLESLRHIFSVGEPLNAEVVRWGREVLEKDIHDTWFQTETGAIMIANRPGLPIKPGSMGKPVNEVHTVVLDRNGEELPEDQEGRLCIRAGWSSMFIAYLNNPAARQDKFMGEYYDSGDIVRKDADGYYWFIGRGDDVINTAGHLVSPFEIESALLEVPEIAEAAVVGVPDETLFEKVVAWLVLHAGQTFSRELELKIRLHVTHKLSSVATPQELFALDKIPKNSSGKIMRRVLKARYIGQDPGDLSTLEDY